MKRSLCLLLCIPVLIFAQEKKKGIFWTEGLTWEQVKEKAKTDNKYIFIDAFTTWCGPCKQMDKSVYVNDSVGDFFNDRFISVKVQMDKTEKDNEQVKSWYTTAEQIDKEYKIRSFPTYIFLSPEGKWAHKEEGMKQVSEFITVAQKALQPGLIYKDANEDFYLFVKQFEQGKNGYNRMLAMCKRGYEIGEDDIARKIGKEYKTYLAGRDKTEWYKRENLEYLASTYISSKSPFFKIFYPDGVKVNKIMQQKDVADNVVTTTIFIEKVLPFYESYGFIVQNMMGGPIDTSEANWNKLEKVIKADYNKHFTARAMLNAKVFWYDGKNNDRQLLKCYFTYLEKYGMDTVDKNSKYYESMINNYCWKAFETSSDKTLLQISANWMEKLLARHPENYLEMDTYANLLHKLGRTMTAIRWEEKALALTIKYPHHLGNDELTKEYTKILNKMREGKPTWRIL